VCAQIAAPKGRKSVISSVLEAAIVLDGTISAMVRFEPADKNQLRAIFSLPRQVLHHELDLILADGSSLLAWPVDLAPAYNLQVTALARTHLTFEGSFTALPWLGEKIGVELLDHGVIMGRALAARTAHQSGRQSARWNFSIALQVLPRLGHEAVLRLRIGGQPQATPSLAISQESLGYGGCIDGADSDHVAGWAIDRRHADKALALELVIDGQKVAQIQAGAPREDLRDQGFGTTAHGFSAPLPLAADPTARRRIGVRIAGTSTELAGSPIIIDPAPKLTGCFDRLHGTAAHGWAFDHSRPDEKLTVELVTMSGAVVGHTIANDFRGDLLLAELGNGFCAFKIDFAGQFEKLLGQALAVRVAGTNNVLPGSPRIVAQNPNFARFAKRRHAIKPGVLPRLKRALSYRAHGQGLSIIMPVFNPTRQFLVEALESVRTQWCEAWELICVDDGSTAPHVKEVLARYAKSDARIRILRSPQNVGIAKAINFGLRAARHEFVGFMDHDDVLEPDAVWQVLRASRTTGADLLYSDEVLTTENINEFIEFRLRPAFSHDYYLSHPYFVHFICCRTALARSLGGWDETMPISADVDFTLRMIEVAQLITHVPAVLYRWRTHANSAGHAKQESVMTATRGAIQRHLDRLDLGGRVRDGVWFNQFITDWPDPGGRVLIVIPTKNKGDFLRKAIESIERTTPPGDYRIVVIDHQSDESETRAYLNEIATRHEILPYRGEFNFSRMNNLAVRKFAADCEFVLFLNNDVEATGKFWIERLRSLAARPGIGAVGPLLMYGDHRVQHAGVILGFNNSADHALRLQDIWLDTAGKRNLGYNCSLTSVRDFSAVTAACMMLRKSVFEQVGGFDEEFAIGFNDTDFCLRLINAGYRVLYDGTTLLYHYESATRADTKQVLHPEDTTRMVQRWGKILHGGDPWYHPMLSLITQDHVPREDKFCRPAYPPRPQPGPAFRAPPPVADTGKTNLNPKATHATTAHGSNSPLPRARPRLKSAGT